MNRQLYNKDKPFAGATLRKDTVDKPSVNGYFFMIYLIYDSSSKLTKIGKSANPEKRFIDIKVSNPNAKLVFMSNKYSEKELHEKYNDLRVSGEWFKLTKKEYFEIVGNSLNTPKSMFYRNFKIKNVENVIVAKQENIILIRAVNGIGIDEKLNGYTLDGKPVKRKVYNGRLCYQLGKQRIGYNTLKNSPPVKIIIDNSTPF